MKQTALISILLVGALFSATPAGAEERLSFKTMGTESGLNSRTVYCAFQDSAGKIWFGTDNGLAGLDANRFTAFRNHNSEEEASGTNLIHEIRESADGGLWLGTASGLWHFDRNGHIFEEIPMDNGNPNLYVRSICTDRNGSVWTATLNGGIFRYDPSDASVSNWIPGNGYVTKVIASRDNGIWCAVDENSIWKYDGGRNGFVPCWQNGSVFCFCEDGEGRLVIGGWDSYIMRYDPKDGECTRISNGIIKGRVHSIHQGHSGNFMFGSDAGLGILDPQSGEIHMTGSDPDDRRGLSDNFVYDVLRDREGGLWVTTYFGGVCYSGPNSHAFSFFTCNNRGRGRITSSICQGQGGELYIGTDDGGLFVVDGDRQSMPVIVDSVHPDLNVHAVLSDGNTVWVGTYGNGLYRYDIKSGKAEHFSKFSNDGDDRKDSVYSLLKDSRGTLWIGTKEGIFSYDGSEFTQRYICGLNSDVVDAMEDADGDIWFASTRKGLIRYRRRTDVMERLEGVPEPLTDLTAMCLCGNSVVFGKAGKGVYSYDRADGSIRKFLNERSDIGGITAFSLTAIRQDVWIASDIGLVCFDTDSGKTEVYDNEDGLYDDRFSYNSSLLTEDGLLLLGTNGGIDAIRPYGLRENLTPPGIELKKLPGRIFKGDAVSIGYSIYSYSSPKSNRFSYTMSRSGKSTATESDGIITFNNLPAGRHRFTMEACNGSDVWGKPASLDFEIVRHWWESVPALMFYYLCIIAVLFTLAMLAVNNRRQRKILEEEQRKREREKIRADSEMELLADIAREIKTPVMLITAPAGEALKENDLPEKARGYLNLIKMNSERLFRLLDSILDFKRNVADSEDAESDDVLHKINRFADDFAKAQIVTMPGTGKDRAKDDFMNRLNGIIVRNVSNQDLDVESLAESMHMSRTVLFNKVREATGMTPNNYIKTIRLRTAADYITNGNCKISEVCYLVGFGSPSYFARCFRDKYGVLPKDFNGRP